MAHDEQAHLLEQFLTAERLQRLDASLETRTSSLTVVLDQIKNHQNVSAIMRTADAFGLTAVHFVGGPVFDYSPGISLGSERWLSLERVQTAEESVSGLKNKGFSLVVLEPFEDYAKATGSNPAGKISVPVTDLPYEKKLALVFGNELQGVSPVFREHADYLAYIPMKGFVESLNVSVACAICLFCSTIAPTVLAQRTAALQVSEREQLRKRWLAKSVKRSDIVLRALNERRKGTGRKRSAGQKGHER